MPPSAAICSLVCRPIGLFYLTYKGTRWERLYYLLVIVLSKVLLVLVKANTDRAN